MIIIIPYNTILILLVYIYIIYYTPHKYIGTRLLSATTSRLYIVIIAGAGATLYY